MALQSSIHYHKSGYTIGWLGLKLKGDKYEVRK